MKYLIFILLLTLSWARANDITSDSSNDSVNDSVSSYFDEGRDFSENPLVSSEIIEFYAYWFKTQEGKIAPLSLQALIPVREGFIAHFTNIGSSRPLYFQILSENPQTLIHASFFQQQKPINQKPKAETTSSGRDFSTQPLTKQEVQNFYMRNPAPNASLTEIKEDETGFILTFTNDSYMSQKIEKRVDKNNPNSLLFTAKGLATTLEDLFPEFKNRNFELSPLSLAEVDDIYKKHGEKISPAIRGSYEGAAYDENQNIRLAFKGGLSGKLFYHIVIPSEPNSLMID